MFLLGGVFFLFFGLYILRNHKAFLSRCTKLTGSVVDVVERELISKNALGQITSHRVRLAPIVEYYKGTTLRFEGQIDVREYNLKIGDTAPVLVDNGNPKVAKMEVGSLHTEILAGLMMFLGAGAIVIGVVTFDPAVYTIEALADPVNLVVTVVVVVAVFKVIALINRVKNQPFYAENAEEVGGSR